MGTGRGTHISKHTRVALVAAVAEMKSRLSCTDVNYITKVAVR